MTPGDWAVEIAPAGTVLLSPSPRWSAWRATRSTPLVRARRCHADASAYGDLHADLYAHADSYTDKYRNTDEHADHRLSGGQRLGEGLSRAGVYWRDIHFTDRNTGYAVGGPADWNAYGQATLIKTTNGGLTWTPQLLSTESWMDGLDCRMQPPAGLRTEQHHPAHDGRRSHLANAVNTAWKGYLVSAGPARATLSWWARKHGNILRSTEATASVCPTGYGTDQWDFDCPPGVCYSASSKDSVLYSSDNGAAWAQRAPAPPAQRTSASTAWTPAPAGLRARAASSGRRPIRRTGCANSRTFRTGGLQPGADARRAARLGRGLHGL